MVPAMALKDVVADLLLAQKLTAGGVERELDLPEDTVRNIVRGRSRKPAPGVLRKLATRLGVDIAVLIEASEAPALQVTSERPATGIRRLLSAKASLPIDGIPIRGVVQAGAWLEIDDTTQVMRGYAPITPSSRYARDTQWALELLGDSMNEFYPPGSLLHVVDAFGRDLAAGDHVIVERRRAQGGLVERSVKELVIDAGGDQYLVGRSRNPIHNKPLPLADGGDGEAEVQITGIVIGHYVPRTR